MTEKELEAENQELRDRVSKLRSALRVALLRLEEIRYQKASNKQVQFLKEILAQDDKLEGE